MRSRNPTPTVLEYAYLFGPAIKENVKQLTKCGEIPSIPQLPLKLMPPADQRILCDWRVNYGQSVLQVTVRNQSTKDNVGTLPLYSYTQPVPTFMNLDSLEASNANDSTDPSTVIVLFQCQTAFVIKPSLVAGLSGLHVCNSSSPFYLAVITSTILQNELELHLSNIDIYLPSENDIFIFSRSCTVDVAKEAVAVVLELTVPVGEKEIVLTEEVFKSVTALLNSEKDARAENSDQHNLFNHAAEVSDEDVDEMEETVCVDTITFCTSRRGRQIRRPLRLDL